MTATQLVRRQAGVLGSTMSYQEAGPDAGTGGPTVLFLHGNPTSSHIWRNIVPHVAPVARCIAPDLIGFGQSGKPDIEYRIVDHVRYLDGLIDALGLGDMAIVAQDWGTALAFHRASRFPESILGLAFMEFVRPFPSFDDFLQRPNVRDLFRAFRTPGQGEKLILEGNTFVEKVLPGGIVGTLSEADMAVYRAPFPTPESRRPTLQFPREIPIAGEPADVWAMSRRDHAALAASTYSKLLFSAEPGALVTAEQAREFAAGLTNCRLVELGAGGHFLQEDHPDAIGTAVRDWLVETGVARSPA